QPAHPAGWNSSRGSWVTVRSGETLYNLSRRYGVPVNAIMSANNIVDGNSVEAGSKILIPIYNYSTSAPISAPDSDPITNASRASRGFQGQPRGRVAVPTARVADLIANGPPNIQPKPEQKLATNSGQYIVKSGDTLSGIAYRTGASVAAIRAANSMGSDTVWLGQKLTIPSYGANTIAAKKSEGVDTTLTGSIPRPSIKPTRVKPVMPLDNQTVASISTKKPATGSKPVENRTSFRWPAEGRVISKFGQRSASGINDGIDISMPVGTPIKASQTGTVIYAGSELEDFGNLILVSHAGGWVSAYAHSSANLVRRGDKVKRGQVIAKSGRSGNAKVPKLHFELRKNSNPVNPIQHLAR
ncbi:MAG: peptidoglycan DD-metalloendopeptidase family protein, partial [Rhizobiaceae bacterium]